MLTRTSLTLCLTALGLLGCDEPAVSAPADIAVEAAQTRTSDALVTPGVPTIQYSYDALGRLQQVTYPSGTSVTYGYDAAGNRTSKQVQ